MMTFFSVNVFKFSQLSLEMNKSPPATANVNYTYPCSKVQPYNIIGAVLQQELILYSGKLIATQPQLFDGILVLRMSLFERSAVCRVIEEVI